MSLRAERSNLTLRDRLSSLIILEDGFVVKGPGIDTISADKPLDEITIDGNFFETKKGKVVLDYVVKEKLKSKNCKVTRWWMDPKSGKSEIKFLVPKGLIAGKYPLKVTNSVGKASGELKIE